MKTIRVIRFSCKGGKNKSCKHFLLCQQQKELSMGCSSNRLQNGCLLMTLIWLTFNISLVSESCMFGCFPFWSALKNRRCICERGIDCVQLYVGNVLSQCRVIDYSDHNTDCFILISFWPYRWEITSTAERMIGGKWDSRNSLSRYLRPVKEDRRERVKEGQKDGEMGKQKEGLISKTGECERAKWLKTMESLEPKSTPHFGCLFYLRWQVCWVHNLALFLWPIPTGCAACLKIRRWCNWMEITPMKAVGQTFRLTLISFPPPSAIALSHNINLLCSPCVSLWTVNRIGFHIQYALYA